MELGATVCTPENPSCDACPVRALRRSRAAGRQRELPARRAEGAGRVRRARSWRATERDRAREAPRGALRRHVGAAAARRGPRAGLARCASTVRSKPRGTLVHVLTHRRIAINVFYIHLARAPRWAPFGDYEKLDLVKGASLESLALSTLARRVLATAGFRNGEGE